MRPLGRPVVAVLLAGPALLAFFTGGYFAPARAIAGAVAWALVVLGLITTLVPAASGPPATSRAARTRWSASASSRPDSKPR